MAISLDSFLQKSDEKVTEDKNDLLATLPFKLDQEDPASEIQITLSYISLANLNIIVERNTASVYKSDELGRSQKEENIKNKEFLAELFSQVVKDIKGLTVGKLRSVLYYPGDAPDDEEVQFSVQGAIMLGLKVPTFGLFVYNQCSKVKNFRKGNKEVETGN